MSSLQEVRMPGLVHIRIEAELADLRPLGGSTACVVASRLADAYPDLSVLMIEGGQNNAGVPTITFPAYFLAHLAPGSTTNLFYKTKKSAALADRELILPAGGVLGGGSSTNFMMYSRAQQSDFDSWGVPGWTGNDMLPYLKKVGVLVRESIL